MLFYFTQNSLQSQIHRLKSDFFVDYPQSQYPEIMRKEARPYNCLLIDLHLDYCICVPFRSDITHSNAYMFKNSVRSRRSRSGLDYSKSVIVTDGHYFDLQPAVVDQDEYNEAMGNMQTIVHGVTKYIDDYVSHILGTKLLHPREFTRRYLFSTLPYFHKEFGIAH